MRLTTKLPGLTLQSVQEEMSLYDVLDQHEALDIQAELEILAAEDAKRNSGAK